MRVRVDSCGLWPCSILPGAAAATGDDDLESDEKTRPKDPGVAAAREILALAIDRGLIPRGDALVSEDEVEEEHERQLGDGKVDARARGKVRRR